MLEAQVRRRKHARITFGALNTERRWSLNGHEESGPKLYESNWGDEFLLNHFSLDV
jgi:hypothetical protein